MPEPPAAGGAAAAAQAQAPGREGFAGSASCEMCHPQAHAAWKVTLHARTVHEPTPPERQLLARALLCEEGAARYVLGEKHSRRFLIPSAADPGRHVLLPCRYDVGPAEWVSIHASDWKGLTWERGCGACHTTGFSSARQTFHELGVGCESCHGPAARHGDFTARGGMAHFDGMTPREEVTVCASCHLQGGRSRATGLNYPQDYDPGDDLFADYQFAWESLDAVTEDASNPIDIHQKLLIREQAGPGRGGRHGDLRCTSCHTPHGFGHAAHTSLARQEYCYLCHARSDFSLKEYDQSCNVCEF